MKKSIFAFVLSLIVTLGVSQSTIEGKVIDDKNNPVYFATVALYSAQDSSVVSAESTDENGYFKLKDLKDGNFYLIGSMIGFNEAMETGIELPSTENLVFELKLETDVNMLETIEIKDRVPLLEQRADKLIVNVADNITNTSGSLLDVMKKVPGMLVINDRLSMAGAGSPTILLNGKTTQYMDVQSLLRDMPGDNIKKVEIIHQPGAEYEASGSGPIINIILKKNSLFGTNGSVSLGVGKGELWDYTTGLNLSHYEGNFNITGGLGYTRNAWVENILLNRRLSGIGNAIDGVYDQINNDSATPRTYRGNVRMDWDITEKHRLGLESKYYNNSNARVATNVTNVTLNDTLYQNYTLNTDNDIARSWNYKSFNPYYIFEIDTSGQKLQFDVNVAQYKIDSENTLTTTNTINSATDIQRYMQPGDTKIFATSLDYTKPLSKVFEIKTGLKYSMADLDNDLRSDYREGERWVNNPLQSNHYLFEERVYAGYGKLNWTSGEWSGTAGLRYENSQSVGTSLTLDSTLTRDISKLFPSASVSKELGSVLKATLSYSYRIDRPRYSTLNPFVYYLDPFTYEQGNPNIRPELTHSSRFTLSYEGQPFFNVEYKKSANAIVEVTQQESGSEQAFKTDVNFDDQTQFSATLGFPLDFIPGVSGYGAIIQSMNAYNSLYIDGTFDRSKWNTTLYLQAEFGLPGDINAELGGWYTGSNQEGIFNSEYLYGTSFGVSKKFLDNKAKISLGVEDFANRFWHANVDYQQDMDLIVKWQAPVVNAKFSYKFGNQHLKSKKKHQGSASEELRRASQGK